MDSSSADVDLGSADMDCTQAEDDEEGDGIVISRSRPVTRGDCRGVVIENSNATTDESVTANSPIFTMQLDNSNAVEEESAPSSIQIVSCECTVVENPNVIEDGIGEESAPSSIQIVSPECTVVENPKVVEDEIGEESAPSSIQIVSPECTVVENPKVVEDEIGEESAPSSIQIVSPECVVVENPDHVVEDERGQAVQSNETEYLEGVIVENLDAEVEGDDESTLLTCQTTDEEQGCVAPHCPKVEDRMLLKPGSHSLVFK